MPTAYHVVKRHYRDRAVAGGYDRDRFGGTRRRRRNERELAAVHRAIARAGALGDRTSRILDLPCGTGRAFPLLDREGHSFVGADISLPMMERARTKVASRDGRRGGRIGLVQCDAERLPFKSGSFDGVVSLRFMLHLDGPVRGRVLAEMRRVSRRWLVIDFRHKYTTRYLTRLLRRQLAMLTAVGHRFSWRTLRRELGDAGMRPVAVFPSRRILRWFSDKWFVLAEIGEPACVGIPSD